MSRINSGQTGTTFLWRKEKCGFILLVFKDIRFVPFKFQTPIAPILQIELYNSLSASSPNRTLSLAKHSPFRNSANSIYLPADSTVTSIRPHLKLVYLFGISILLVRNLRILHSLFEKPVLVQTWNRPRAHLLKSRLPSGLGALGFFFFYSAIDRWFVFKLDRTSADHSVRPRVSKRRGAVRRGAAAYSRKFSRFFSFPLDLEACSYTWAGGSSRGGRKYQKYK